MLQEQVDGAQEKVLVLGDESDYVKRLKDILNDYGYPVAIMPSLEAALVVIRDRTAAAVWIVRKKECYAREGSWGTWHTDYNC
jgi:DNA-binding NtrC family response regulator